MNISIYTGLIFLVAVLIGSLGLVIYAGSSHLSSRAFAFSLLWVMAWTISTGFLVSAPDQFLASFYNRFAYFLCSTVASAFLYFFLTYPEDIKPSQWIRTTLIGLQVIFLPIYFWTDSIVGKAFPLDSPAGWGWNFGPLSFLFDIFFLGFFIVGLILLYNKYKLSNKSDTRTNFILMIIAVVVGAFPPLLMCDIFPRFGYYDLDWLGPITGIVWIFIIAYSIIKYRQMSVRMVGTEVFVITMIILAFLNIFLDFPFGIYARIGLFAVFTFLGYFLIKSLVREDARKEELHTLNSTLSDKVAEQTREIRHSYELEKRARLELEKLNDAKDQFIMITQHHLRTPTTSIMTELESMAKGAYGKLSSGLATAVADTKTSADRLMRIVNDFLNITAIKVGTNILNVSCCSLKPAIEDVLAELKTDIEPLDITIAYPTAQSSWPELKVDYGKMKESLFIVIENAIRYNRHGGSVTISTTMKDGLFELTIENTGIGITTEESAKIGSALFYRGEHARSAHATGMGIGLSVVKAIIKAHHGTFSIESKGRGDGARVKICLPE